MGEIHIIKHTNWSQDENKLLSDTKLCFWLLNIHLAKMVTIKMFSYFDDTNTMLLFHTTSILWCIHMPVDLLVINGNGLSFHQCQAIVRTIAESLPIGICKTNFRANSCIMLYSFMILWVWKSKHLMQRLWASSSHTPTPLGGIFEMVNKNICFYTTLFISARK